MAEAPADQQLKAQYPAFAWALDIPDLRPIFTDPNITNANQLQVAIQGTNWWKTTAPAVRNWLARTSTDPEGAQQDIRQKDADVWDLYNQVGLKPDPTQVEAIAHQALMYGWTTNQLKDAVVSHMQYSPEVMNQVGTIQSNAQAFMQKASDYFVPLSQQSAFQWAKSVAAGEHSAEDYIPVMQQQAKSRFAYSPDIMNAIDRGVAPKDYFAPYQSETAKLLEISPEQVDFMNNPRYGQMIDHVDDKGVRRPMTLSEAQTYVRGFDEFGNTQQAKDQAASIGQSILKTFGAVA